MIFIPVIMSGGAGTRLWPVSREAYPKPFMKLEDGDSLLMKALGHDAFKLHRIVARPWGTYTNP